MQKQLTILTGILLLVGFALAIIILFPIRLGLDLQGGSQLTIQIKTTDQVKTITAEDLEAVKTVIENRVNGLGVSEPFIQTVGNSQIEVQLPGINDPVQAERVLGGTAKLEFREQKPNTETQLGIERQIYADLKNKQEELKNSKNKDEKAIADNKLALERSQKAILDLFQAATITGKNLKYARPEPTSNPNDWNVGIGFDTEGGTAFTQLTKNLAGTGRSIGIFLDDELISSPVVGVEFAQTGITGGGAVIQGRFTIDTANELAIQLRGGSLPVPIEVVQIRTVGATLGLDSIISSIYAAIGGLILVFIFMISYYRLPGVIASISLMIYAILSLAAFSVLGVTLTLPGIAGAIMSIGMAVDANVLIFERMREELQEGKTLYKSVQAGFDRAFSSILDSNVTTLIASIALFIYGTALIKGFAITLSIGVAISMFTALTCTQNMLLLIVLGFPKFRKLELFAPKLKNITKLQGEG